MFTKSVILVTLLGGALAAVSKPTCNENLTEDYVQDPEACNRYYRCVNGQMHDFSCPFGMHWQQEERKCVLEGQSTCRMRPNDIPDWPPIYPQPTTAPPNTPPTAPPTCAPGVMVAWPDNHDCRRFYLCIEGDLWHMWCQPGTRFDYMTRRCDPNAICVPGAVVGLEEI
ncbi:peritrophin-1-like [Phlebotomus papatasi]|uniref:peritrophin-1-like n=1 Tax=Phlebotomus papatasi TaxID=29031 RepID=UPI0024846763|nr:peritrophin-1-like [Phlebotomus papatasi]